MSKGLQMVACQVCLRESKQARAEQLEQSEEWRSWKQGERSGDQFLQSPVGHSEDSGFYSSKMVIPCRGFKTKQNNQKKQA